VTDLTGCIATITTTGTPSGEDLEGLGPIKRYFQVRLDACGTTAAALPVLA
jgi:hypothetical protein